MADIVITIKDGTPAYLKAVAKHEEYKAADLAKIDAILARPDLSPDQRTQLQQNRADIAARTVQKTIVDLARIGMMAKERGEKQPALEDQARALIQHGLEAINQDLKDF